MKKLLFSLALLLPIFSFSQGSYFGMSYQVSLPVGNTADYISTVSGRGFGIDYKGFVTPEVAIGGMIGWNVFYEAIDAELYDIPSGNGSAYGQQWRYINSFPFLLTADYFLGDYGDKRFFAGLGLGAYRVYQRLDMGIYTYEPREWMFGLAPQVGVLVPMNRDAYFHTTLRFNYGFESGDIDALSYLTLAAGFAWN